MAITTTDGSRRLISYQFETTPGVAPAAGTYQTLRSTVGVKIDLNRTTITSKERRSDLQEANIVYGNIDGKIDIPVEWSYGTYDDLLEAIMGGTWTSDVLKMGTTVRTIVFEDTAPELELTEQALGVQLSGFTISNKLNAIATGNITGICRSIRGPQTKGVNLAYDSAAKTITRSSAGFLADGWAVGDAVLGAGNVDAGNNNATPWIITTLTDTVMTFTTAVGIVTAVAAASIVLNMGTRATTLSPVASSVPFDSFTGTITDGGVVIGYVTGWDLKLVQTLTANFACGSDTTQSVSQQTKAISGGITVYFVDQTLRKKFLNGTGSTLSLVLGSVTATKAYTFDLGTVKYTSNTRADSATAVIETLAFAATYTPTDTALKITRTP